MTTPAHRRSFAFSLRTLFVVVTLLCCWLANEATPVRERHAIFRMLEMKGGLYISGPNNMFPGPEQSTVRRLLGDVPPQAYIFLTPRITFSDDEILRIKRAFPEATVKVLGYDTDHSSAERWPTAEEHRRCMEQVRSGAL